MLTRYVRSFDGASLAVSVFGDEHAPLAILVRPWTTPATVTAVSANPNALSEQLSAERYVVTYDRRGTGASSRDATVLGLDAQIRDVLAVADALGFESADLVAFFDSTPIAIACAARHPGRVRKLVLWHPIVRGSDW